MFAGEGLELPSERGNKWGWVYVIPSLPACMLEVSLVDFRIASLSLQFKEQTLTLVYQKVL